MFSPFPFIKVSKLLSQVSYFKDLRETFSNKLENTYILNDKINNLKFLIKTLDLKILFRLFTLFE